MSTSSVDLLTDTASIQSMMASDLHSPRRRLQAKPKFERRPSDIGLIRTAVLMSPIKPLVHYDYHADSTPASGVPDDDSSLSDNSSDSDSDDVPEDANSSNSSLPIDDDEVEAYLSVLALKTKAWKEGYRTLDRKDSAVSQLASPSSIECPKVVVVSPSEPAATAETGCSPSLSSLSSPVLTPLSRKVTRIGDDGSMHINSPSLSKECSCPLSLPSATLDAADLLVSPSLATLRLASAGVFAQTNPMCPVHGLDEASSDTAVLSILEEMDLILASREFKVRFAADADLETCYSYEDYVERMAHIKKKSKIASMIPRIFTRSS
ncbi:uncharacterized protein BJ171DRAFT_91004 [Polychytrium aggregatum]|uniref:uncharacterized protein n=1 Tax=Polychytrium aggregatum TaxID=110093 RepID=UPI0022FED307|nr:uncharacterized protein BJ171DRAFT_91004 [Polychytrium aggregatum]KAI9204879.1 hypothetical protein BJ171DRAFT_91004 [Polychytrium aggregatum]